MKKQPNLQGKLEKKIVKKITAKGFLIRIRSYITFDGKKIYSKWSAPIKIK